MTHFNGLAVGQGTISRNRLPADPRQFFAGAAFHQQWNEIAQFALVEARIYVLDYTGNMLMR
jgi:hypothetical protein